MLGRGTFISAIILGAILLFNSPSWATAESDAFWDAYDNIPLYSTNGETTDFARILETATRVQTYKPLYDFLNTRLESLLEITPEQQLKFGWPAKAKGLSESQIVAILERSPRLLGLLDFYFQVVEVNPDDTESKEKIKAELEKTFSSDADFITNLKKLADPTVAYPIMKYKGKYAVTSVEPYVNHPILLNENGKMVEKPASDLKQLVKTFIRDSKTEIWANFFDFDLMDVAEEFGKKAQNNVEVHLGIDKGVIEQRPEVQKVVSYFEGLGLSKLQLTKVSAVGLNHMKIIVRDPGTPNAAILLLSGNLTQSCIGPEGDLVGVPENLRPKESVPNANHAILVKGDAPAIFTRHHLRKVLLSGMRGQSGFPVGGAYKFFETSSLTAKVKDPWMILSFSPNGGMGDINTDILKQVILTTTGPIRFLQFAFSSPMFPPALAMRVQRDRAAGLPNPADFGGLGDSIFAMRDFSVFLSIGGLQMDKETKVYSPASNALVDILTDAELLTIQRQTYVAPNFYGERTMNINGVSYKISSKIHHKVMIVPDYSIAVAGTSFNFSMNAESNNEQIAIFRNEKVANAMMGALNYLERESKVTVSDLAQTRNDRRTKNDKIEARGRAAMACRRVFAGVF
jgi:hypothetical protein